MRPASIGVIGDGEPGLASVRWRHDAQRSTRGRSSMIRAAHHPSALARRLGFLLIMSAFVLAACAGGSVSVEDAWVRPQDNLENPSAGYMTITNNGSGDDVLVGASSPASERVEIHETMVIEPSPAPSDSMEPGASMGTGGDMVGMVPVQEVDIPAGGTLTLEPGSFHLMFVGLRETLEPGDTVEVTLSFRDAGSVKVTAQVREP
jgi:copper(I)-binding protein